MTKKEPLVIWSMMMMQELSLLLFPHVHTLEEFSRLLWEDLLCSESPVLEGRRPTQQSRHCPASLGAFHRSISRHTALSLLTGSSLTNWFLSHPRFKQWSSHSLNFNQHISAVVTDEYFSQSLCYRERYFMKESLFYCHLPKKVKLNEKENVSRGKSSFFRCTLRQRKLLWYYIYAILYL